MQDATTGLVRLYKCIAAVSSLNLAAGVGQSQSVIDDKDRLNIKALEGLFQQAMDNDFNTAQAQGIFFDTAKTINRILKNLPATPLPADITFLKDAGSTLKKLGDIMGILREEGTHFLDTRKQQMLAEIDIDETTIDALVAERFQCRAEKNWARSDEIRDQLLEKNIELKDGPDGTEWSVKRS